jgi:hypothetical protein
MAKRKKKHRIPKTTPARVRINSKVAYHVLWTDSFVNDEHQTGLCDANVKQIIIKKGLSVDETFFTLLHEILHAASDEDEKLKLSETQVHRLELFFKRFIKLNNIQFYWGSEV